MYAVYTDCTQLGIDAGIRKRPTAPSTNTLQLEKAASNLKSLPISDSAPSSRDSPWFAQASPEHLRSWRISQICNMLDFRRVPVCSRGAQLRISVGGTRNDSDTRDDSDDSLNRDRSAQLGPFGSLRQPLVQYIPQRGAVEHRIQICAFSVGRHFHPTHVLFVAALDRLEVQLRQISRLNV